MIFPVEVCKYIPTFSYFYIEDESKHGFLVDPGAESEKLWSVIQERKFHIEGILLTHGHFDHIGAVNALREKLACPVYMQRHGRDYAENPAWKVEVLDAPTVDISSTQIRDGLAEGRDMSAYLM